MFGLGTTELLLILVAIVMLFGLGKLPMAAKQLGLGVRNFQKGVKGDLDEQEAKKLEGETDDSRVVLDTATEKEKVEA